MFKKCVICKNRFKTHLSEFQRRKCCSRKCSNIWRSKISKGKVKSKEWKKNIGLAHLGKKRPPFSREWRKNLSKARKGKKFTFEHCKNISLSQRMEKGNNWKGGIIKDSRGYILIKCPTHPFHPKNGYVNRSHLVMEKMIGRYLKPGEIVHHKGTKYPIDSIKNKQDDRPENLQLFANDSKHTKFHNSLRRISN